MIVPTVGRVVLVHRFGTVVPALICFVHSNTCINVGGFDEMGNPFHATSIYLKGDEDLPGWAAQGVWAEWMPYQKKDSLLAEVQRMASAAPPLITPP